MEDLAPHVRTASSADLAWLTEVDGHLSRDRLERMVECRQVLVAEIATDRVGLLRFDQLWSTVPFIALVRVLEPWRRRGIARSLVGHLAVETTARGGTVILSSATGNEREPLAWHEACGFSRCGTIHALNDGGVDEVIFRLPLPPASS